MKEMKRILSFLLCFVMVLGLFPAGILTVNAATGDPIIVIAGSDYQDSNASTTVQTILGRIQKDYSSAYGFLFGGDYATGYTTNSDISKLDADVDAVYSGIADENRIFIQGNHETYGKLSPSNTTLLDATGEHDTDYYGVYAINYEDFGTGADDLKSYLDGKSGYTKPIFVMSHQPLHVTSRSNGNDNIKAVDLFEVLNNYDDLNIIFLFGHNHSGGYDAYLGNGSIYLKKGDSITVAGGSTETLNFTYMNYGYVGYVSGSSDTTLTMTAFEIYEDEVIVKRYDEDGLHNLKAAGATVSGYNTDKNIYGTAVIDLSTGESTTSAIGTDSGDDNTGSGGTTGGSGNVYTLVDTMVDDGEYLIVSTNADGRAYAMKNPGGDSDGATMGATAVTIENGRIITDDTDIIWKATAATGGFDLTNGTDYLEGKSGKVQIFSSSQYDNRGWSYADNQLTESSSSNKYVVYYSDEFTYGTSGGSEKVYIFQRTTETGSGGGSTVTPEGGDWVTISDGKGKIVYKLDTDGVDTNVEYLIVAESYAKALSAAASSNNSVDIEIDGDYAYADSEDYGWTFTSYSNGVYYIRLNGSTYLNLNSTSLGSSNSSGSSRRWTVSSSGDGSYTIVRNSYYLRWSNSNSIFQASNYNRDPVRLYKYDHTDSSVAEYAKLDGELTYTVSRGASADEALGAVMEGIDVVVSADKSAETILDDGDENITWTLADNYDGAVPGEYAVTITYKGVKLGTAKVIVPEATIVGYELVSYEGSVSKGASKTAETGAYIRVDVKDDEGEDYLVPVTLGMLTDADGNAPSTREIADITGLTVSYNGQTFENFTLHVVAKAGNNYPEYPNEGHVKVSKSGTGIEFQSTGVAQVEVSAFGIPMNQGVDVLLVLDTSSSMEGSHAPSFEITDEYGNTKTVDRMDLLRDAVNNLIVQFKTKREDGSDPDIDIAIINFNGNTVKQNTNYIGGEGSRGETYGIKTGDETIAGAWEDINEISSTWATDNSNAKTSVGSGTNYDYGLQMAYDVLAQKQLDNESERQQFVLFLSDGAPSQYNGVESNDGEDDYLMWLRANYDETDTDTSNDIPDTVETNKSFYAGFNNDQGQLHHTAEAIKAASGEPAKVVRFVGTNSTGTLEDAEGLGATVYSIGLLLKEVESPTTGLITRTVDDQETVMKTIASTDPQTGEKRFTSITSVAGLGDTFTKFGNDVLMAAYDARYVDQMGDDYDLQLKPITKKDGTVVEDSKIEVLSYEVYTKAEADADESITEDMIGDRKSTTPTVLETVTFNNDGTEAYSNLIDGGNTNILIDGVICAKNFWYNTTAKEVEIAGVDIPTGKDSANLTTGSTNKLPAETFYWKLGTLTNTELALRYYVYLTDSLEGSRKAGSYPTNNFATLYYDNYLENPCYKDTVSPVMPWLSANVSYAFYLVDKDGNVVVNQTTGETGSFANKIAITNPVVFSEIMLNSGETIPALEVADVLPSYYTPYDADAVYHINVGSGSNTSSWKIEKGDSVNASTYVMHYDTENPAAYSTELNEDDASYDYTHTVVWFAVEYTIEAHPDTVVIDYGLPVDISVLTNDMFGENGKLAGVGAYTDGIENTKGGQDMASGFGTNYNGTYGSAKADAATGKVRYTLSSMQMNGYEKFAYAVNYTGSENAGYYYDTVTVIPATTIYYEDDFVTYDGYSWDYGNNAWADNDALWTTEGTEADALQGEDRPGQYSLTDANNIYGYDGAYTAMSQFSLGSARKLHVNYDQYGTFQFTFYGTGFDLISMTSAKTGGIVMDVYEGTDTSATGKHATYTSEDGNTYDCSFTVDTYYGYKRDENGKWVVADSADPNALYQVPVMEVADLPYGQYTVVVRTSYVPLFDHGQYGTDDANTGKGAYDFYLDAIRIYDPAHDGAVDGDTVIEDAYKADGEGWPSYIELRNQIIAANSFDNVANEALTTDMEGLVFIDGDAEVGNAQIEDYISYGPNNEVYLAPGQSVAFQLVTPDNIANVHIGIKSADGKAGTYTITNIAKAPNPETGVEAGDYYGAKTYTVNTATDMYYDLTGWKNDIIVITNTGDQYNTTGIISLTNIKSTYTSDPNATETTGGQTYGLRNATLEIAAVKDQRSALSIASVDAAAEPVVEEEVKEERFETYIYMTPAAAALVVDSLNSEAEPEIPEEPKPEETTPETTVPEETVPETTVPEETVPEETEPEPTVPEETEPEEFDPAYVNVKLNKTTIKVGQKVLVTVTTSADVDYVIINDTVVTNYSTGYSGKRTWKQNVTGTAAGTMRIEVVCCNDDDVAAEPIVKTVTVQRKNLFDLIFDLFN